MRHTLLILTLTVLLAGCGFQPLHGRAMRESVAVNLDAVQIETDNSRRGQLLKAEIEDSVNPDYHHAKKQFKLAISFTETEIPLFVNPDGTSSRGDLQYNSNYRLIRLHDSKVVSQGMISRVSSYNTSQNAGYASYVSEEDARKRAILELAQDYKLRLANLTPIMNDPEAKEAAAPEPAPETLIPNSDVNHETRRTGY